MATRTVNGNTYHVKTNRHARELHALASLPDDVRAEFEYITGDDTYTSRIFLYRGAWYDSGEFFRADNDILALGFEGVQTESYFSAVAVSYFTRDGQELYDEIIVGYIHW